MAEYRERLLAKATLLVDNVKELLSNVSSKEALIITTEMMVMTARELAEEMKAGSASLGTDLQEAQVSPRNTLYYHAHFGQVCLLSSTKVVASDLSDLIVQAKTATEQKESIVEVGNKAKVTYILTVQNHIFSLTQSVIANIANLLKTVKTVEDASSRGIRAMETALQAISQDLAVLQNPDAPSTTASPEDLVAASRAVTQAVARAVMAANSGDQDQVAAAANMGRKVMSDLLTTCKVRLSLAVDI
jgi:talin